MIYKVYLAIWVFFCCAICVFSQSIAQTKITGNRAYYVSNSGNDSGGGTKESPYKTIAKINTIKLNPGDGVFFKAGETFKGTLAIGAESHGSWQASINISSYGKGKAIIDGDSVRAISLYKTKYILIENIKLIGLGRKTGNRENGLAILNSEHIAVDKLDISGFQKSGLLIYASVHVNAMHVSVHDNGSAGITVEGENKKSSRDIFIYYCRAENNPGDPTKLDNHSGNGIVVGNCTSVKIEHCTANNNGWDMPRVGNGPVGIWCYEADSVIIQYCLSYENKTSKGGADGGGYDLDGGTTNSVIEHCFSYGNQGSGYCIFQYWGASPWHDNVVRYNITENDGAISDSQAGLYVWNSSDDPKQFYNCKVYGNIVYNSKVAALSFSDKSENGGFDFYNNIFVGKDSLIKGKDKLGKCRFTGNDWWSIDSKFNAWGIKDFKTWATQFNQEQKDGKITGLNINPPFKKPGTATMTSYRQVPYYKGYHLPAKSELKKLITGN